jgi:putative spermidine/putrescine transport system ATP-binding protein
VGTSNLVSSEVALVITGSPEPFSIRPEKIRLAPAGTQPAKDEHAVAACVRDVVYLGLYTRYLMELEEGGDLVVVEQNLHTTSMDALAVRGQPKTLIWKRNHNRYIGEDR